MIPMAMISATVAQASSRSANGEPPSTAKATTYWAMIRRYSATEIT